ncbi:MAG: hypothetical protein WCF17_00705 [Terracidiphilus sp.]
MHREKLITAACALGILACGACFLPPPRPAAPPLAPDLRASRRIRVEVANLSPTQHVPPQRLGRTIVERMNGRLARTDIRARTNTEPKTGDAVLHIEILQESVASKSAPSYPRQSGVVFNFSVFFNGTLTAANGAVVWRVTNRTCTSQPLYVSNVAAPWDDSNHVIDYLLAQDVVDQIFGTP